MATKEHCDFFKLLYDEEAKRYEDLANRAKLILTLLAVVFGSTFLKVDVILGIAQRHWSLSAALIAVWTSMTLAVLFISLSLVVRRYEKLTLPIDVVDELEADDFSEEMFIDCRIADFVVATDRNSESNHTRSRWLKCATYILVFGVLSMGTFLMLALIFTPES